MRSSFFHLGPFHWLYHFFGRLRITRVIPWIVPKPKGWSWRNYRPNFPLTFFFIPKAIKQEGLIPRWLRGTTFRNPEWPPVLALLGIKGTQFLGESFHFLGPKSPNVWGFLERDLLHWGGFPYFNPFFVYNPILLFEAQVWCPLTSLEISRGNLNFRFRVIFLCFPHTEKGFQSL